MSNEDDVMRMTGVIQEVLPNATFRVKIDDADHEVIARAAGRMRRRRRIRILRGDRVEVDVSLYDPSRGRIVWRHRS